MPGQLDIVAIVELATAHAVGRMDDPRTDLATLVAEDLLGGDDPVGPGHEGRVAEEFERVAGCFHVGLRARVAVGGTDGGIVERRLDPLHEIRRAVAHFGEDPGTILDVCDRGVLLELVDEGAGHTLDVAGISRAVEELRRGFHP